MDMPDRIAKLLVYGLALVAFSKVRVLVGTARDHVEIKPLRRLRLAIHKERKAFRARVAQPFLDGEAVALRLRNLLSFFVEEELVVEPFWRRAAERAADFARELHRVDQILAGHFVI